MGSSFSIDLPDSISELVTSPILEQYTISGPALTFESKLRGLKIADLFPAGVADNQMASCCISGLWLLHNFLDRSHEISQDIHSREGSFWHAIMHRLEGDFGNSKYWYRKVGEHPVFESMPDPEIWDPYDFVDQCELAQDGPDDSNQKVQQTAVDEWKTLFEYCFRNATR